MSNGDIEVLLRSRVPLIVIESRDESRVLRHLQLACRNATPLVSAARSDFGEVGRPSLGVPLFFWTITDGLRRADADHVVNQRQLADPLEVLKHIRAISIPAVFTLIDFHPFLKE